MSMLSLSNIKQQFTLPLLPINLTILASGLHFYWGAPRVLLYYQSGVFSDWRPYALALSAVTIWAVLFIFRTNAFSNWISFFCLSMMSIHIVGYCMWHLLGHPVFDPITGSLLFHSHPNTTFLTIIEHLRYDQFALTAIIFELSSVILFLYLIFKSTLSK